MKLLILIIFFLITQPVKAAATISGLQIEEIIKSWLEKKGKDSKVDILDTIKYPHCDNSDIFITDISGSFKLIKISCLGSNKWSLITRNKIKSKHKRNLASKNSEGTQIITLRKAKSAGSRIKEEDLIIIEKKISKLNHLVIKKRDIVGKKLKKSVSSGKPLYEDNFEKDWLIKKNSPIIIENKIGGITIKEEGMALEDADYMEEIKVKNIKSGKILNGYVENKKKVVLHTKQN